MREVRRTKAALTSPAPRGGETPRLLAETSRSERPWRRETDLEAEKMRLKPATPGLRQPTGGQELAVGRDAGEDGSEIRPNGGQPVVTTG